MNNVIFASPKSARITDLKYAQYSDAFARMGLTKQTFRAVGQTEDERQVFVHPDDVAVSVKEPLSVRRDMLEFTEES